MGKGALLGILSGLGDILSKVLNFALGGVMKIVGKLIGELLSAVFTLIQYFFAGILYEISIFLLRLIDFVEILFRSFAGLPSVTEGEISLSINGKSGDLLIQMLTSKEVLQVFYATAIVGVFLLIITTIFSMIKVEYTTEGAQNSKSSIIGKSLKSLCNMLIIPLLCIMGVFIGNQVLDLIDTATGGGNKGSTISGTLWVTAASPAMLKTPHSLDVAWLAVGLISQGNAAQAMTYASTQFGMVAVVNNLIAGVTGDDKGPIYDMTIGDPSDRSVIEDKFARGELRYDNMVDLVAYYFPFEVNYIVLIFAACIIIKCLYHTCFGLVDRLYQCTALFIIMPMVVGMSPVKDSLGSWRSKFISKALSAYGTIISLNLFFIISRIMLNIDIKFKSGAWFFPVTFMSGLIKTIMVLVGCLMIEKLAGDLGGYFGGGNAMADGAGLERGVSGMIKKGVQVAGTAALMAAGAVSLGIGTGAALAGKLAAKGVGKGLAGNLANAGQKASKATSAAADAMKKGGFDAGHLNEYGAFEDKKKDIDDQISSLSVSKRNDNALLRNIHDEEQRLKHIAYGENGNYSETAKKEAREKLKDLQAEKSEVTSRRDASEEKIKSLGKEKGDIDSAQSHYAKKHKGIEDAYNLTQQADAANAEYSKAQSAMKNYNKKQQEEKETKSRVRKERLVRFGEGTQQAFKDRVSKLNPFKSTVDEYNSAADKAMGKSDEGAAMNEDIKNVKKKRIADEFDARHKGIIALKNLQQLGLTFEAVNSKLAYSAEETTKQLEKLAKILDNLGSRYGRADDKEKDAIMQQAYGIQEKMQQLNGKIEFEPGKPFEYKGDLKVDLQMDSSFMKKMQDQIKKGVKMDDIMAQIKDEFKRMGLDGNDKLLNEIYKALEELKGQVGGK